MCDRAKEIVTMLENSNISMNLSAITSTSENNERENMNTAKEIASILRDIDMNKTSPIEAFDILNSLVKKVKKNG